MASQKKAKVQATIRINAYAIIAQAVEDGIAIGYRRAYKHTEKPGEDYVRECIQNEVMSTLCEYLVFDDPTSG